MLEKLDDTVYSYATLRQQEIIDCFKKNKGNYRATARALNVTHGAIRKSLKGLLSRCARQGYSPEHDIKHQVPDGYKLKGTSTLYDDAGNKKIQWVKSTIDQDRQQELLQSAIEAATQSIPRMKAIPMKGEALSELANLYTITDYHIGMLAWSKEGGDDWDIKIAETTLLGAFSQMIASSPKAEVGIVNQLGDFLHFDGMLPVTPTNRHVLDADSRFAKLVKVAIRCLRAIVDMALSKHKKVHVICAEGNHDLASASWLQHLISNIYENEPRLTVDTSPKPYYVYKHGSVMLGFSHGHMRNGDQLPSVFAAEFAQMWGNTKYRYCHEGHRHHKQVKENAGMIREMHQTLAARDAHASRGGYMSERGTTAITYHKNYGEVSRVTIRPEMIKKEAA